MGFVNLSSVTKAFSGIIKQVAPSIIKAVAGPATSLLKGVVGDLFTKGGGALTKLVSSVLPGPLGQIASKLLGKGLSSLQGLAEKGVESLVNKLADTILKRFNLPGVKGDVAVPPLATRIPDIQAAPVPNAPSAPTGNNTGAATGGSTPGAPTGSTATGGSQGAPTAGGFGWSGGAPSPVGRDMSDPNVAAKFQDEMMKYQQAMTNMNNYFTMMSSMIKSGQDATKTINGNIR